MAFSCTLHGMQHSIVDSSYLAADIKDMPETLGLRPQTIKLRFASPEINAACFMPEMPLKDVLPQIHNRLMLADNIFQLNKAYYKEFIGETVSLIYAPYVLKNNRLYDALLDRPAAAVDPGFAEMAAQYRSVMKWKALFLSTLCPNCGADTKCGSRSTALTCSSCNKVWQHSKGLFSEAGFSVIKSAQKSSIHLPFWRMDADITGIKLSSYADLVRHANLPKAVKPEWEKKKFSFWAPAFKTTPEIFKRLTKQLTVVQPDADETIETALPENIYDISFPESEAQESIMLTIADLGIDKKELYPNLKNIRVSHKASRLVYLPFSYNMHEFINQECRISLHKNILKTALSI